MVVCACMCVWLCVRACVYGCVRVSVHVVHKRITGGHSNHIHTSIIHVCMHTWLDH